MIAETEKEAVVERVDGKRSIEALLSRVRLRAQRRILWLQFRSNDAPTGDANPVMSPVQAGRMLEDPLQAAAKEESFYQTDEVARALCQQIQAADLEFSLDPAWTRLRRQFVLSDFEIDLLTLSVAAGADPSLLRAYAYLHDDAGACYATPWLAGCLFQISPLRSLTPESPLVKWRLAHSLDQSGNPWVANAPWAADPHIMLWLLGLSETDPLLGGAAQFVSQTGNDGQMCLYPQQLAEMLDFVRAASQSATEAKHHAQAMEIEIVGADGAGKRTLAAQFAAALGADLLAVDADSLIAPDAARPAARECILHAIRTARLTGALLYWHNHERSKLRVWDAIEGGSGVMLFGCQTPRPNSYESHVPRLLVRLPALRAETKMALWRQHSSFPPPSTLAEWTLTPGQVVGSTQIDWQTQAAMLSAWQEMQVAQSNLFSPLACPFDWDDIVVPLHLREHLRELEQQIRLRWSVYEEWGYERLCPLGRGITALFSGPSGTGKTMAAQVLARSLGMKLFRVDLSGVMNKYIGETEKRLKQVFDACERANVLLFFDEADALFGQRTVVKDAHDRFANIEIDYLLQRMEQFEGAAILATNRKGDLDKAFVRRIRFILDFIPPGPSERVAIWRRVLLPRSPKGEELLDSIDINSLAQKLSLTGAEITAAALAAAFLACAEGSRISMRHVLHAAQREMAKNGAVMRIGDWGN